MSKSLNDQFYIDMGLPLPPKTEDEFAVQLLEFLDECEGQVIKITIDREDEAGFQVSSDGEYEGDPIMVRVMLKALRDFANSIK